jgi:hypothetical protein
MEQSAIRRRNLYLLVVLLSCCGRLAAQPAASSRTVPKFSRRMAEIENIVLTITQGNDGKEPHTGYRIDVGPGVAPGGNSTPMFTIYTCGMENNSFNRNSTATIILKPDPQYKGACDLATLQSSGGHIHIWPICYLPNSTGGISYDRWDITNISMTINLKPTADNPNPQPIGGPASQQLNWSLSGANMLVLSSQSENQVDFYFDSNLEAQGSSN